MLKLSVLDQSPVSDSMGQEEAIQHTVTLAQHVEKLGYHRFWVSEHHNSNRLAGSSPEVLIAHLAAKTNNIRVGSGGVMLPHYSPYKVAENFKVLEALNKGRIDLGIGRAPGGMPIASMALQQNSAGQIDRFPEQTDDLLGYLYDDLKEGHPFTGLKATPLTTSVPDLWLLGSSSASAQLAAAMGLPYTFANFINSDGGPHYMQHYLSYYQPSRYFPEPRNMVAIFTICAETEEEANTLASSLEFVILMRDYGKSLTTPKPEIARSYSYNAYERERLKEIRRRMIVGSPEQVRDRLIQLSKDYLTNEIMLVTITYDFQAKLRSFELIAEVMN